MVIRQEESTPIGDCFHDLGVKKIFERLSEIVDNFEVDTDEVNVYCDNVISMLKIFKSKVKNVESDVVKRQTQEKVADLVHRGGIE